MVGWFYNVSTLFGSFNGELDIKQFSLVQVFVYKRLNVITVQLNVKTVLFQTIQFFHEHAVSILKTLIFQTIQFIISTQISSI